MSDPGLLSVGRKTVEPTGRKYFDYHHTAADTLDKVDPQDLRENATAMAVMGYALASMPVTLPR